MKTPSKLWLAPLLMGVSGWAGYAWGSAGKPQAKREAEATRLPREPARDRWENEDSFTNYERLLGGKETEIWKAASRLPEEKIPEALRRLRELQAVTASESADAKRLDEIESALYFH